MCPHGVRVAKYFAKMWHALCYCVELLRNDIRSIFLFNSHYAYCNVVLGNNIYKIYHVPAI